jgi:ABC-2 type transport system permease protein
LANKLELYLFLLLVIITTAAFTGAVTLSLRDPEEVMLYVPFFSVGLIFLSGTSFPMVQIPHFWQLVHYFFPSSPAIAGYIQLNSMGGSLHNIAPQIAILAVQLLIYGTICILQSRKIVNLHKQP